jgi:hypothetical protein
MSRLIHDETGCYLAFASPEKGIFSRGGWRKLDKQRLTGWRIDKGASGKRNEEKKAGKTNIYGSYDDFYNYREILK